jgi:hypothetical protein
LGQGNGTAGVFGAEIFSVADESTEPHIYVNESTYDNDTHINTN